MTGGLAATFQQAKGDAEGAAETVRRRIPFVDHLVRAWFRYQADAGRRLAAALTFYGFLSFFPLVALAYSITGFVVDAFPNAQQKLTDAINSYLPGLADTLDIAAIGNAKVASGLIGLIGLLFGGLGWVNSLREAMRTIWHHNIQAGNIVVKKIHDTFILAGLGLAVLLSVAVTGAASAFANRVIEALNLSGTSLATYLLRGLGILLAVAADTVVYGFLFTRLPKVAVPMRRVLRGALFAAVGLEVLKVVGVYLVPRTATNPLYLTFGVLFGLLIWINLVSRWTLLAAAWTVTAPYDTDVAPSGTASAEMARMAGIPERYASNSPDDVSTTMGGGVPSPLHAAVQGRTPPQDEPVGRRRRLGARPPAGPRAAGRRARRPLADTAPRPAASGMVASVRSVTPRTGAVLLGLAAWTAVTWLDFLRRLVGDREHKTAFYVAHGVLIVANLVMAGMLARIGLRIRRASTVDDAAPVPAQREP